MQKLNLEVEEKTLFTSLMKMDESRGKLQSSRFPSNRTLFLSNAFPYFNLGSYQKLFKAIFSKGRKSASGASIESVYLNKDIRLYGGGGGDDGGSGEKKGTLSSDNEDEDENENETCPQEFIGWACSLHFVFDQEIDAGALEAAAEKAFKFRPHSRKYSKSTSSSSSTTPVDHHLYVKHPDHFLSKINSYMNDYEAEEKRVRTELEQITNEPDEDGFVTVTRHHKKNVNRDSKGGVTVVAISSGQLKQGEEKAKKSKEQVDFYRFQMRQAKRERLADLRRKFMEDKEKIAKMKESRKFRPY